MPRIRPKATQFSKRLRQLEKEGLSKRKFTLRPEVLLCGNIPTPMHGMAPRVVMGASWWEKERQISFAKTEHHCLSCGVHKSKAKARKWVEGHELYDIDYRLGLMTYVETVPLCHYCHLYIHDGRMLALVQKGQMHAGKMVGVLQHGDKVLEASGYARMSRTDRDNEIKEMIINGTIAEWGDWRLVLHGEKYPPLFATKEEYEAHYA